MSTYSQAWHDCPPEIRDSYISFSHLNTFFCTKFFGVWGDPDYPYWFERYGVLLRPYRGVDIFYANMAYQLQQFGHFDPAKMALIFDVYYFTDKWQPPHDKWGIDGYHDQFVDVPLGLYYPRAKYRIRKSYWTGAPRRRRNL